MASHAARLSGAKEVVAEMAVLSVCGCNVSSHRCIVCCVVER